MPQPTQTTPRYRRHKPSGRAVVTLSGQDFYLGPHGTKASRREYDRLIAEWLAAGRRLTSPEAESTGCTVSDVMLAYWRYAQAYHVKHGRPTPEQAHIKGFMRTLRCLYGRTPAAEFGPLALKAVRQAFIDADYCRGYVNSQVGRVKRMFKWAVANEMIPVEVHTRLQTVDGLRRGRSAARETEPVKPAPNAYVDGVQPFVSRQVWAMIELQRLTGMRPQEVTTMRGCDVNADGKVWVYKPTEHKTAYRGKERAIYLGPRAQEIVQAFLKSNTAAYLFSPAEAEAERLAARHRDRKTSPLYGNRPGTNKKRKRRRPPADHYTTASYRRAIERGCDLAFAPVPGDSEPIDQFEEAIRERTDAGMRRPAAVRAVRAECPELSEAHDAALKEWRKAHRWHPHQLRHNAATRLRKEFGIEAARVVLGHSSAAVTEIYAEVDKAKAADVMRRIG